MNIPPSSFRQKYTARLLRALRSIDKIRNNKELSLLKRRKRIKLVADISLALTSNGSLWSHALISKLSKVNRDKTLLHRIIGRREMKKSNMKKARRRAMMKRRKVMRPNPYQIARSMVSQRTKLLKRLIPGGEAMDSCCLLKEAADYIISLRTQVEVMQSLANNATQQSRQTL